MHNCWTNIYSLLLNYILIILQSPLETHFTITKLISSQKNSMFTFCLSTHIKNRLSDNMYIHAYNLKKMQLARIHFIKIKKSN